MTLQLVPVDWRTACGMVADHHRHHAPPRGYLWAHGVADDDLLVGVAIVGRPVARAFDDGRTVEVTRTVTDGHPNANSMLYGAVARAAFAKGYRRVVTYTQAGESGASLRAAGYRTIAERPARKGWDTPSRPRHDNGVDNIPRTLWGGISMIGLAIVALAGLLAVDALIVWSRGHGGSGEQARHVRLLDELRRQP